jgi:hypothetical protein
MTVKEKIEQLYLYKKVRFKNAEENYLIISVNLDYNRIVVYILKTTECNPKSSVIIGKVSNQLKNYFNLSPYYEVVSESSKKYTRLYRVKG